MAVRFAYKGVEYPTALKLSKELPMLASVLVQWSEDADWFAANVASLCYDTDLYKPGSKVATRVVEHCRDSGHNTVLEHNVFSFVKKVPIFVARQDLRARHASFDERSLRYCRADDGSLVYYTPKELSQPGREEELKQWHYVHEKAIELYSKLTDEQILEGEKARSVLPVGIATTYTDTRNAWAWRHHSMKRLCLRAQEEIRLVRRQEVNQLIKVAPLLFGDLNMPCYMQNQGCPETKTCGVIPLNEVSGLATAYERMLARKEQEKHPVG